MSILDFVYEYRNSSSVAVKGTDFTLTYEELWRASDKIARFIIESSNASDNPPTLIPVYGHKSALMLVCFLGIMKSGAGYCPIDSSFPDSRIQAILETVDSPFFFNTTDTKIHEREVNRSQILDLLRADDETTAEVARDSWLKEDDVQYVIFTSGSSGKPKGVQITARAVVNYLKWINGVGGPKHKRVYLNQAPFSFDLSVMDLSLSLGNEGTLYCLGKDAQADYTELFGQLQGAGIQVWVSTPSFADLCLANRDFNQKHYPTIETFLFCGETLTPRTAKLLVERFPSAKIINTYGPTESTVCITDIEITPEIIEANPVLPIGRPRPGTTIRIENDGEVMPDQKNGEIIIIGDTVSVGYYKNPEMTEKKFFVDAETGMMGYRSGDKGYLDDGMLFFGGRLDLQIKLHGYRIELEDVESNILRVQGVERCCVLPNFDKNQKVKSMTAYVVFHGAAEKPSEYLRLELAKFVPAYMIPKKITMVESIPMTANGKIDRKAMQKLK